MKNYLTFILIVFTACTRLQGQYQPVALQADNSSYSQYQFIEQVDLITDHDFYLSGEKIHMALNTYDATFYMPSALSAIVYVELYTQDNQIVAQQKVRLENGSGMGSVQIPKTLLTGYYYLRAYTNYMKNYGPAYFYTERLEIVNPFYPVPMDDEQEDNETADTTFQVIPEGDKLISGMPNKVVYTAKVGHTYCHEIAGRVVDASDSVIIRTHSDKGIGSFTILPEQGNNYRFEGIACGQKISTELPMAHPGHNTILMDSLVDDKAYLNIMAHDRQLKNLKLQVTNNGIQYASDYLPENAQKLQLALPVGINYVELVSPQGKILAKRYIAVAQNDHLQISLESPKQQAGARQPITLKIRTSDHRSNPVPSNLSVSVRMNDRERQRAHVPNKWKSVRFVNMKRTFPEIPASDYKPFVNNIARLNDYLVTVSSKKPQYDHKQFKTSYTAELDKDIISGSVTDVSTGKGAAGKTVYQSFVDSIARLSVDETDSAGRYLIELPESFTGKDMYLVVADTSGNYKIKPDSEFSKQFLELQKEVYIPDKSLKDLIQQRMINMQLADAYNINHAIASTRHNNLRFYGYPDESYRFIDYVELPTMEEFAFEVVKGTMTQRVKNNAYIYVLSEQTSNMIGYDPLYLVDGVPILDKNKIATIPPEIMKTFHVVTGKYYYKTTSFDGIIDLNSQKGDFSDFDPPENAYRSNFVPVQDKIHQVGLDSLVQNKNDPLYHTTLYFNTEVTTNDNGEAEVQLYTPDNAGKYSIIIYGHDADGKTGYSYYGGYIEVIEE